MAPPFDRIEHGSRLDQELRDALRRSPGQAGIIGSLISFVSFPGLELVLERIESHADGTRVELVSVREHVVDGEAVQIATVYVPDRRKSFLLKKLAEYADSVSQDKPRHAELIEAIASIRRATIRGLRFAVRRQTESRTEFQRRINAELREEGANP